MPPKKPTRVGPKAASAKNGLNAAKGKPAAGKKGQARPTGSASGGKGGKGKGIKGVKSKPQASAAVASVAVAKTKGSLSSLFDTLDTKRAALNNLAAAAKVATSTAKRATQAKANANDKRKAAVAARRDGTKEVGFSYLQ